MSVHILLNLFSLLGKRDKLLCKFANKFNKVNNTVARKLDSIYRMTLKPLCHHVFNIKTQRFCHIYVTLLWASLHNVTT